MAARIFTFCDSVSSASLSIGYFLLLQDDRGKITLEEFRRAVDYQQRRKSV